MEAMWTRFVPLVARAEALVRAGEIGDPLAFEADFGIAVPSRESRVFRPELGGGALLDLGVYLVAMARAFLGPPLEASGHGLVGSTGVDEQASVLLRHPGDRHSLLLASIISCTPAEAVVLGTRGRLRIHPPFYCPHRVSIERWAISGGLVAADPKPRPVAPPAWRRWLRRAYQRFEGVLAPVARRPDIEIFEPVEGNGYHHQAAEVARCIRAGEVESPRMPLDETVAIMDTLDLLRSKWGVRFPSDRPQ
jgi:predicted dehydrogenase